MQDGFPSLGECRRQKLSDLVIRARYLQIIYTVPFKSTEFLVKFLVQSPGHYVWRSWKLLEKPFVKNCLQHLCIFGLSGAI